MRLPAILAGIFVLVICYLYVETQFGKWTALIGLVIIAFLPSASVFSILGRGHIFIALFTLISFFCINTDRSKITFRSIYIIASVLAFYTAPTYFYPFCAFIIFKVIRLIFLKIPAHFRDDALIIVFVILLYSIPMLSFGGYELLISSNDGFRFNWDASTKSLIIKPFNWLLFPAYNYISLIVISFLPFLFYWNGSFLRSSKYKGLLLFYLSNLIVFTLVFLFQTIEIPPRIITYFNILNGLAVAVPIGYYLGKIKYNHAIGAYLFCLILLFTYSYKSYQKLTHNLYFVGFDEMMASAEKVSNKLIAGQAHLIYSESEEINSMIKLTRLEAGKAVHFTYDVNDPNIDYYVFDVSNLNLDEKVTDIQDTGWDFEIASGNKTLAKVYKCSFK